MSLDGGILCLSLDTIISNPSRKISALQIEQSKCLGAVADQTRGFSSAVTAIRRVATGDGDSESTESEPQRSLDVGTCDEQIASTADQIRAGCDRLPRCER
jgi:hypothetical protein